MRAVYDIRKPSPLVNGQSCGKVTPEQQPEAADAIKKAKEEWGCV
ncbi:TPA: hypothetical protein ACIBS5_004735 [Salmonella enterica subsp. diarizonae serovar 60-67:z35:-]